MLALLSFALLVLSYIVLADAILSWVMPSQDRFPRNITGRLTAPLYAPVRALIDPRRTGGMDVSPIVVLLAIHLLRRVLGG